MRKIIGISVVALLAGIAGAEAQSQAPQGTGNQSGNSPVITGTGANNVPSAAQSKDRRNSGPPYSDCYLKCINSGNPADYCQDRAKSYCS
jgi:hypothetical protein